MDISNSNVAIKSPSTGTPLKEENGLYVDEYSKAKYLLDAKGELIELKSPYSNSALEMIDESTFYCPSEKKNYIYDPNRSGFIGLFIPDYTMEDAHIEGNYLVGNETGRRFPILDHGYVQTVPDYINDYDSYDEMVNAQANRSQAEIDAILEDLKKPINEELQMQEQLQAERVAAAQYVEDYTREGREELERLERELEAVRANNRATQENSQREIANIHNQAQRQIEMIRQIGEYGRMVVIRAADIYKDLAAQRAITGLSPIEENLLRQLDIFFVKIQNTKDLYEYKAVCDELVAIMSQEYIQNQTVSEEAPSR